MASRARLNMNHFLNGLNSNSPPQHEAQDDSNFIDFANTDFLELPDFIDPALNSGIEPQQSWDMDHLNINTDFSFNPLANTQIESPMLDSPSASKFPSSAHAFDPVFSAPGPPASASKRKLDLLNLGPAESARLEAEEDKRRRNTAASARFRVKKKQREQQLEKTAKEMTDKANKLEKRVHELELENKWLKGLITEKTGTGTAEFTELFDKFLSENESSAAESERISKASNSANKS